jgi:hypothetical protein
MTSAMAVATPEELPVTETLELVDRVQKETQVALSGVIVNRVPPPVDPAGRSEAAAMAEAGDPLAPLAAIVVDRHERGLAERSRLASLGLPMIDIGEDDDPVAAALAAVTGAGW